MTPELKQVISQIKSIIADKFEKIIDLSSRRSTIISDDEFLKLLAILFRHAPFEYKITLTTLSEPFRGNNGGKGSFEEAIKLAVENIEGERVKSGLAKYMDDSFDANQLEMKKGDLIYSVKNLSYIIKHLTAVEMVYDKFFRIALFRKKPWPNGYDNSIIQIGQEQIGFTDTPGLTLYPFGGYHTTELQCYLNNIFPGEYRWNKLPEVCYAVANTREFDSYQWWIENCVPKWDGIDRSDWLEKYCGVDPANHQWNCLVGMKLCFVAMVARCLEPGIHSRVVLVFEGDQNTGKSRLAAELAFIPEAFTKLDLSDGFKEAKRMIKGMAVAELADLGSVDIVNQNRMKDFISDENNRTRNMHQEDFDNEKRRGIMVLTVNNDNAGYLADITGNTRFAPVTFTGKVDIGGMQQVKMQLWAQALHLHRQGMRPWLTDEEEILQKRMIVNAERHFREYELCELFVANRKGDFENVGVTTMDVIEWCRDLSSNPLNSNRSNRSYLSKFVKGMERLGCHQRHYNNASGFKGNNKPNRYWHLPKEN